MIEQVAKIQANGIKIILSDKTKAEEVINDVVFKTFNSFIGNVLKTCEDEIKKLMKTNREKAGEFVFARAQILAEYDFLSLFKSFGLDSYVPKKYAHYLKYDF